MPRKELRSVWLHVMMPNFVIMLEVDHMMRVELFLHRECLNERGSEGGNGRLHPTSHSGLELLFLFSGPMLAAKDKFR